MSNKAHQESPLQAAPRRQPNGAFKRLGAMGLNLLFGLALLVTACTPTTATRNPSDSPLSVHRTPPAESATPVLDAAIFPTTTPTAGLYSSAPQDGTLDMTCRITINFFFDFKKGSDVEAYRKLFSPGAGSLADAYIAHPPAQARTILVLMPASQWWRERNPATPIPGALLPEGPNEYTYIVEYTGYYDSDETPFYAYPDTITMIMVSDGPYSCTIINYGKG